MRDAWRWGGSALRRRGGSGNRNSDGELGGTAWRGEDVLGKEGSGAIAKMASHAIFQYNGLAIDDTHNTWTNVNVKMTILRLLGSSDDKEKIGVVRPKGPP